MDTATNRNISMTDVYKKLGCTRDYFIRVMDRLDLDVGKADKTALYLFKHPAPDDLWGDDDVIYAFMKCR